MVTAIYAALTALLIVKLSLNVIRLRRQHRVSSGDGGHQDLLLAIRTQGNATEYIPIALILLALLEMNHAHVLLVHAGGIILLAGRLIHAYGLPRGIFRSRVLGMQLTLYLIIILALANLGYVMYHIGLGMH